MTNLPDVSVIEVEINQGWLTIWFNQPEKRNPMSDAMVADVTKVLNAVRDDRNIRGITFRGRGGVFCAGGDLKSFQEISENGTHADILKLSKKIAHFLDLVNAQPQVTVVFIEGAAMAGGFGLTCCADVVICETDAKFAMTETMIGLSPAQIAPFIIQRLGYATARRLMLTAARFKGSEAQELGLADFIANSVEGLEEIEARIKDQVLACAPQAIADTKDLILALPSLARDAQIDYAAKNFTGRMKSVESKEGIASFFEKRKPHWGTTKGTST